MCKGDRRRGLTRVDYGIHFLNSYIALLDHKLAARRRQAELSRHGDSVSTEPRC